MQGRWPLLKPGLTQRSQEGNERRAYRNSGEFRSLFAVIDGCDWRFHGLGGRPSHAAGWRGWFHAAWVVAVRASALPVGLPIEKMLRFMTTS